MNESSLLPLLREKNENGIQEKILLISTENDESIKYMPQNLLYYLAIVRVDEFKINQEKGCQFSNSKKVLEQFCTSNGIEAEYKKVKKLLHNSQFSSLYRLSRENIIAYSYQLSNIKEAIRGYMRSELKMLCDYNNNLFDQVEKNINAYSNNLESDLIEILRSGTDE